MSHRPAHLRGFTLIELILVMVIISIALAVASPSMRGWGQGQKLRNATDSFIAATGYARTQAVTLARVFAVEINAGDNTYAVQAVDADGVRTPVAGEFGQPAALPIDYTIKLVSGGGMTGTDGATAGAGGEAVIVFYPDARSTPAAVEIKSSNGDVARVESRGPAEPFRDVKP